MAAELQRRLDMEERREMTMIERLRKTACPSSDGYVEVSAETHGTTVVILDSGGNRVPRVGCAQQFNDGVLVEQAGLNEHGKIFSRDGSIATQINWIPGGQIVRRAARAIRNERTTREVARTNLDDQQKTD
jgi:hypothetical protein